MSKNKSTPSISKTIFVSFIVAPPLLYMVTPVSFFILGFLSIHMGFFYIPFILGKMIYFSTYINIFSTFPLGAYLGLKYLRYYPYFSKTLIICYFIAIFNIIIIYYDILEKLKNS